MEEIQPQLYILLYQAGDGVKTAELQGRFEVVYAAEEVPSDGDDVDYVIQTANDGVKLAV